MVTKCLLRNSCQQFILLSVVIHLLGLGVIDDYKFMLQRNSQFGCGCWYLEKDCTVLRIYGAEVKPYKFPVYLTAKIFALGYPRWRIDSYERHFVFKGRKSNFTVHAEIFPFIINARTTLLIVEKMIKAFNFEEDTLWKYDPHKVISNLRTSMKFSPYSHIPDADRKTSQQKLLGRSCSGNHRPTINRAKALMKQKQS